MIFLKGKKKFKILVKYCTCNSPLALFELTIKRCISDEPDQPSEDLPAVLPAQARLFIILLESSCKLLREEPRIIM
jgi:hypothetical protein